MNVYIEGRINKFSDFYNSLEEKKQIELLKDYVGGKVSNLLGKKYGREHSAIYACFLIEKGVIKIGENTFEELVDEIENYLDKKRSKLYPQLQRDIIAYFKKKYRYYL